MELTEQQKLIYRGLLCPYCKNKSEFVDSKEVYGKSFGMIYLCRPCKSWVGTHENSSKALGRLANAELREAKKEAHLYFDKLWNRGQISRKKAYKMLSDHLKLPKEYTHIGMFNIDTCNKVVEWSKKKLNL